MGKFNGKDSPSEWGVSVSQIRGSWFFGVITPNGEKLLVHCSPVCTIREVIQGRGLDPESHTAKMGSTTLDLDKCLEDYRINLNGSTILGDRNWDGLLRVVKISSSFNPFKLFKKDAKKGLATLPKVAESNRIPIFLTIQSCSNLPGVDKSGTSDPYVEIGWSVGSKQLDMNKKTKSIDKNCNPVWNEAFQFDNDFLDEKTVKALTLNIAVKDKNVIHKDVLLVEAAIPLKTFLNEYSNPKYTAGAALTVKMKKAEGVQETNSWIKLGIRFSETPFLSLEPDQYILISGDKAIQISNDTKESKSKGFKRTGRKSLNTSDVNFNEILKGKAFDFSKEKVTLQISSTTSDAMIEFSSLIAKQSFESLSLKLHLTETSAQSALPGFYASVKSIRGLEFLQIEGSLKSDAYKDIKLIEGDSLTRFNFTDFDEDVGYEDNNIAILADFLKETKISKIALSLPSSLYERSEVIASSLGSNSAIKGLQLSNLKQDGSQNLNPIMNNKSLEVLDVFYEYKYTTSKDPVMEFPQTFNELCKVLKGSSLKKLRFRSPSQMKAKKDSLDAIQSALNEMEHLEVLEIDGVLNIGIVLGEFLERTKTLRLLCVKSSELIPEEATAALLKGLENNATVKVFITLHAGCSESKTRTALISMLNKNKTLEVFQFSNHKDKVELLYGETESSILKAFRANINKWRIIQFYGHIGCGYSGDIYNRWSELARDIEAKKNSEESSPFRFS